MNTQAAWLGPPLDPLYRLLPQFVEATGRHVPTVNLDPEDLDELRALLIRWRAGANNAAEIVERFALPRGALS